MNPPEQPSARTSLTVYTALIVIWVALVAWLYVEHRRVETRARENLLNRVRDVSNTIALLSRSGRPDMIRQSRLEDALRELTTGGELSSIALFNSTGNVVAAAGGPLPMPPETLLSKSVRWERDRVIVINPVEFGEIGDEPGGRQMIVLPGRGPERRDRSTTMTLALQMGPPVPPHLEERMRRPPDFVRLPPGGLGGGGGRGGGPDGPGGPPGPPVSFDRPPWLSPGEFDLLRRKRGLHGFAAVLSTDAMRNKVEHDGWLRVFIAAIAFVALGSLGLTWHGRDRNMALRLRLVRSQEMNDHLRELNLAAAGLAHETRNPLNVVRTMAQLVQKDSAVPEETRARAQRIVAEVDTVAHRLDEFIKYSRPAEPRPASTDALALARDVIAMLQSDCEEKNLKATVEGPQVHISADESLLRQVIFNLVLNAIQSANNGGRVVVRLVPKESRVATLSVEDDGPGVLPALRAQIFSPYFTTRAHGSGLGLAVVRQIALAHQWEVECDASELGGARFAIRGLKILTTDR